VNKITVGLGAATVTDGDQELVADHPVQRPPHRSLERGAQFGIWFNTNIPLYSGSYLIERHRLAVLQNCVHQRSLVISMT
jgi:hypothetical protein